VDQERHLLTTLSGEHAYDRAARAGNWFALWIFVFGPAVGVGIAEAHLRGAKDIQLTPSLVLAAVVGGIAGAIWVGTFNRTRYRIDEEGVECVTVWPRRSWKTFVAEVESTVLEPSHGHWVLWLRLRGGLKRKIVLTRSMREKLGF
jgi:hypothetical protein